jgi:hypothetical protein
VAASTQATEDRVDQRSGQLVLTLACPGVHTTMVTIAFDDIGHGLRARPDHLAWLLSAYTVGTALALCCCTGNQQVPARTR